MFWQVDHLIALAIHPFQETWDVPDCLQSCTAQEEGMNDTRLSKRKERDYVQPSTPDLSIRVRSSFGL